MATVVAGEHDLRVTEDSQQERTVAAFSKHPNYDRNNILNDIAVVKLSSPLNLTTSKVSPISLNDMAACPETNSMCSVAGWGTTSSGGYLSMVPLKVDVPVQPQAKCATAYA
ncbi:anionic trypsin-2-like [Babylonia areolata]|uniref:anionic trypsin-2-like n=1 Tax=Babylonia areolata TaxID=304850 RepID=UPI003FD1EA36